MNGKKITTFIRSANCIKYQKKYDSAKTPFHRILLSEYISQEKKQSLTTEYEALDPVDLMAQFKALQDKVWKSSWGSSGCAKSDFSITNVDDRNMMQSGKFSNVNRYYHTNKKADLRKVPRTWRTRKDPFEKVWNENRLRLELAPETTAREIIQWFMKKYPNQFSAGQTRTLQRRIAQWRQEQGRVRKINYVQS